MTTNGPAPITTDATSESRQRPSRWRVAGWTAAALVLLAPLVAMQVTDVVAWSASDFALMAVLLLGVSVPLEWAVRTTGDASYRRAVLLALAGVFFLVWLSLGVGIIGADGDPANVLYGGVLAVGVAGALLARFRARGMARALVATALAQGAVALGALIAGLGGAEPGPLKIGVLNGLFVGVWLGSAALFRRATRARTPAATPSAV